MRVVVTGAAGWIGGAIVEHLVRGGHEVIGVVRSQQQCLASGAVAAVGDLSDLGFVAATAERADGFVHAASASRETTVAALEVASRVLEDKPLVYVSGSSLYGPIGAKAKVDEREFVARLETSEAMAGSAERLVWTKRGIIVVGAGVLYGCGRGATPEFLTRDATRRGEAWYVGDGDQRWSIGHVDDLAALVVLALERAPPQRVYNAVAEPMSTKYLAEVVARNAAGVDKGAKSVSLEIARAEWGEFWSEILAGHLWLDGDAAKADLGWYPAQAAFGGADVVATILREGVD
ncbi:hypothetical protein CTAYLR_005787 [Chrysophaeum taylorii]|uniref:NAD-dependent epimerase/dehydratase domain-containing protein n=1 Tax=Chrysophaeum taylorii TaxID=2483200 RepID=A0AAD7XPG0_9STRA|nr:hypothetical protein CTAYLR_005787 [Chrysophaeum taylorii]